MSSFSDELLETARLLLQRQPGQRGRLPAARVRRSISTTYYALFNFILEDVARRVVGTEQRLRIRRHDLARTISHNGVRVAFDKLKGRVVDRSVANFYAAAVNAQDVEVPRYVKNMARAFSDAFTKRQDADYNLSQALSEQDARLLLLRVQRVIRDWRNATSKADRDVKHATALLILLKGQLRSEK